MDPMEGTQSSDLDLEAVNDVIEIECMLVVYSNRNEQHNNNYILGQLSKQPVALLSHFQKIPYFDFFIRGGVSDPIEPSSTSHVRSMG